MNLSTLPPHWRDRIEKHQSRLSAPWLRWLALAWLGLTGLALVAAIVIAALFNSGSFHAYLIRTIDAQASESMGTPVYLENFAVHPSSLSADLYGLLIEGTGPNPAPPVLQVDHIHASVRVVSILRRAWYLDDLKVDRPIVQIVVDKNGVSNIPTFKSSGGSNNTSVFDLGVRHAMLDQGEVYYNDRPSALSVDVHDVEYRSAFDPSAKQYNGTLTYSNGHLAYESFRPVGHDLEADFQANPNVFNLTGLKVIVGGSRLNATATVSNYSAPVAQAHYNLTVDGGQVASLLSNPSIPSGVIQTWGSVEYRQTSNLSLINSLVLQGDLNSQRLDLETPSMRSQVVDVRAHYELAKGDLTLSGFSANVLGGTVTASGTMKNVGGDSHSSFEATVRRVSLNNLTRAVGAAAKGFHPTLTGELNATAKASWGKSLDDLVAQADATIHAEAAAGGKAAPRAAAVEVNTAANHTDAASSVPLNSEVHALYSARDAQLTLTKSYLRTEHTNISFNGTLGTRSNLAVGLQAGDLSEIDRIAAVFETPTPQQPARPLGLGGSATFQGTLTGSTAVPHVTGHLTGANIQFNGSTWKALRSDVDLSPSMASLQHAVLEPASQGKITLDGHAALTKWSFTKNSSVLIEMNASHLKIGDLTKLAGQQLPVTGIFNAQLTLHGTQLNPVGNGNISLTNVDAYGQPVRSTQLTFAGDGQQVHGNLVIDLPTGSIRGNATVWPGDKTYVAELNASDIHLDRLEALKTRNINATGTVGMTAKGQGSFDNPELESTLQIPTLLIQGQTISAINLKMNVVNHVADAVLTSSALSTSIQAKAKIGLTGDYLAEATLDTKGIPLQPLLAVYAPEQAASVTGQTEVHATLHGPLKRTDQLEAHVSIPVLKVAYGNSIQLAATSPIQADYRNGVVKIQRSSISGTNTELHFQGSIPVSGTGPMSLLLQGSVNLQLAQLFDPDVRSSGQLKFNIDSNGSADANDIGGQIDIVDASFSSAGLPVGLQHGNGVLKITKDRINISSFSGTVGGGTVTAQGGVAYRPAVQFNMGLAARGIRILYPQGTRENVDADLRFVGNTEKSTLGGSVNLTDLSFTPGFDLSTFVGQFSGGASAPPSEGMAQNVLLNIALRSSNNVNLVSRTLSVGGSANLQVRGTAADPVILGRVDLSGGDIILNGNRYVLNGGTIQFINPNETEPVVNVSLNTNIQQYSIDLRFQGPVDQLRTEYNSDPALPAADIIHLLAFGNTTEASAAAAGNTSTLQTGESLVASQVSSQVTSRVSRIAGISQLSISPVLAGSSSQGPPGAVITIQQRVTGNLFVNFSTNVASTQSQTIQGQYKISPRVSVSATRDPNGGFGFDALIKKSW